MQIVGIVGMLDIAPAGVPFWKRFESAFKKEFPEASFDMERHFYFPWQRDKIRTYARAIVERFDTGEEVILVGHSWGGVIAASIACNFTKSPVRLVVTVAAPHRIKIFYQWLGGSLEYVCAPIVSFECAFGILVPFFIARHPKASFSKVLFAGHLVSFLLPVYAKIIAKAARMIFDGPVGKKADLR